MVLTNSIKIPREKDKSRCNLVWLLAIEFAILCEPRECRISHSRFLRLSFVGFFSRTPTMFLYCLLSPPPHFISL
jgi:hypothetical protein